MLPQHAQWVLLTAVFLVSFSSLCFEVLLARVFAVSQWNHLVFMVISIALLGFAAAGTFLSILKSRKTRRNTGPVSIETLVIVNLVYPVISTLSFLIVNHLPLDYFRLPLVPIQSIYLLLTYLLLVFPFFLAGLVISSAYSMIPEKTGIAYLVSMTGSACGAILPAALLPYVDEGRLIVLTATLPLLTTVAALRLEPSQGRSLSRWIPNGKVLLGIAFLIGAAAIMLTTAASDILAVRISPYKALAQMLQLPDSRVVETRNSLTGLTTIVTSPHVRFAPGLSLKFTGDLPQQKAIYRDGDNQMVLYEDTGLQKDRFAAFTLSYSAYKLAHNPSTVLIVQNGGGLGMACARVAGIRGITLVEEHAAMARIAAEHYRFAEVKTETPRQFLSHSTEKYDLIHVESWGTSLPGTAVLNQEYLLTLDALTAYLEHLSDKGIILISRRLLLPPSDALRLWATAFESMKTAGFIQPEDHMAVLRNWDTYVLLISHRPLTAANALSAFAEELNFDWIYMPHIPEAWFNRFYVFDAPYHSLAIGRLATAFQGGREEEFFNSYFLDISPQSDDRPFPYRFLKWQRLVDLYRATGSRMHTLLLSGEVVIAAVFLSAVFSSLALLGLPVLWLRNSTTRPAAAPIVFFLFIGAGFMLVELYFIKRMVLIFGDPVVSFTVILAGMLVFSGMGGFLSQRLTGRSLNGALIALILVLSLTAPLTGWLSKTALTLPSMQRYVLVLVWLAVPGVLAGIPFPLAMRHCLETPVDRAFAWTANGCTSVLASIAAAQLAISQGITAVLAGATLAYGAALICAVIMRRTPVPPASHP